MVEQRVYFDDFDKPNDVGTGTLTKIELPSGRRQKSTFYHITPDDGEPFKTTVQPSPAGPKPEATP